MRLPPPFRLYGNFFETFLMYSKDPPFIFSILCNRMMLKNLRGSPPDFRHYETVLNSHFPPDIRLFQYISTNYFFNTIRNFQDRVFSVLGTFSNLFSSKPPQFLLEIKGFASIESLGFSVLCDLPETFFEKKIKTCSIFVCFSEDFG